MDRTNLIGLIVFVSLLLVLSGCGGKDSEKKEVEKDVEAVVAEGDVTADEPELPDDAVTDAGSDVTDIVDGSEDMEDSASEEAESDDVESVEDESSDSEDSEPTAKNFRVVSLKDLKAYPEELTITVGTTVEWRNVNDNLQHIIGWKGQKAAGITPEPILAGESWSYTFNEPGEVKWFSTARPTIQGVILVTEEGAEEEIE